MTNAVIKSVLLLTPGNSGHVPSVVLAKGSSTGQYFEGVEEPAYLVYHGNMTYGETAVDTLDADFPATQTGAKVLVSVVLSNTDATFTGGACDINGEPLPNITSDLSNQNKTLTLTFSSPSKPGQTTGYTKMIFPTSLGYIDPDSETERDPN